MDEDTKIIPLNKNVLMEMRYLDDSVITLSNTAKKHAGKARLIVVDKSKDCSDKICIGDEVICSNTNSMGTFSHGKENKAYLMISEENVNAIIRVVK